MSLSEAEKSALWDNMQSLFRLHQGNVTGAATTFIGQFPTNP
jgi:hypothetical protein